MVYYVVVDDETGEQVSGSERYDSVHRAAKDSIKWNRNRDGSFSVEEREEQSEETEDSQDNMSYDFITNGDEEEQDDNQTQFNTVGSMWNLGDHSTAGQNERSELSKSIEETMAALDDDIDGDMKAVLEDASDLVSDTRISKFECPVESCGLGHSHPDHKHDVRDAFDVLNSFTNQMAFCPYCHCGVNELAMLMAFFPYISEPVFADQERFEEVFEIPPDVLNEMYRIYNDDGATVSAAAGAVAARRGASESELIPLGTRDAIKSFFGRRQAVESAANAAPIAQETRNVIENNREELETATSR